jgi:hypothetical protein
MSVAGAEDFKTVNGKEYKDTTISHVEEDGIVLRTKSGITKLYFTELPKDVQERFREAAKEATLRPCQHVPHNRLRMWPVEGTYIKEHDRYGVELLLEEPATDAQLAELIRCYIHANAGIVFVKRDYYEPAFVAYFWPEVNAVRFGKDARHDVAIPISTRREKRNSNQHKHRRPNSNTSEIRSTPR